jgi:hypothetical protein
MEGQASSPTLSEMILDRFALKSPLPASLRLAFEQMFEPAAIDAIFEAHREEQYLRQILFSTVVHVMFEVVSRRVASVNAAAQARKDTLGASITALYEKIKHTEPRIVEQLVAASFRRARDLVSAMGGLRDEPLPGYRLRILDGNHLAATERRLEALWQVSAGPLPGIALVAFDYAAMMMSDVLLCEDGHAQERSLTDRILTLVQPGDCWIKDRNFCTLALLFGMRDRGGHFITRQHANFPGARIGPRRALGRCDGGEVFEQLWKVSGEDGASLTLRRVTVVLDEPTRHGEPELHILTSLPPEIDGRTVVDLYRQRWTIESAFGELARWLNAEIAPLGYPRAALLGFGVGLMAFNAVATLLGGLRAIHGEAFVREHVSGYYIVEYGRLGAVSVDDFVEPDAWTKWNTMPVTTAAALLKTMLARINVAVLKKHPRKKKTPVPPRTRFKGKPHVSTKKLIDGVAEDE